MNKIKFVNFRAFVTSKASLAGIKKEHSMREVFAGMWPLTVLTKDGFAGYQKLQEESLRYQVRKSFASVLQKEEEKVRQEDL